MKKFKFSIILLMNILFATNTFAGQFTGSLKVPAPNSAFQIEVSHDNVSEWGGWDTVHIKCTNISSASQDIGNASIAFDSSTQVTSVWGGNFPGAYPDFQISSTPNNSTVVLGKPKWVNGAMNVNPGQSFTISFSQGTKVDVNALQSTVKIYTGNPVVDYGKITITMPKAPGADVQNQQPSAELIGPNGTETIKFDSWNTSKEITSLPYGSYKVHPDPIGAYQGKGDISINLNKDHQEGTTVLAYEKVATADLYVQIQDKPNNNAPDNITLKYQDITKGTAPSTIQEGWGKRSQINNLVAGDNYKVWTDNFTVNDKQYIPDYTQSAPYTFKADAAKPAEVQINYSEHAQPMDLNWPVKFDVSGLPDQNANVAITLTGTDNNNYKHDIHNGKGIAFDNVKTGVYNIAADTYEKNGTTYRAIVSNPYTINKNTTIDIQYVQNAPNGKRIFAPYIDYTMNWKWDNSQNKMVPPSLTDIADKSGVKNFTLAFVLPALDKNSHYLCQPSWGSTSDAANHIASKPGIDDINAIQRAGGKVIISFGGQNGPYLSQSCANADDLANAYNEVVITYHPEALDFDVEGGALQDKSALDLMMHAIKKLQQQNAQLQISFTLPVLPSGLTADGINVIQTAINNGVNITHVNIMAMDYGSSFPADKMGQNAIDAAQATFEQLTKLYSSKTESDLWAMIGVTPMIGVNDVQPEIFTTNDAQQLVDFSNEKGIGLLAQWSVNNVNNG